MAKDSMQNYIRQAETDVKAKLKEGVDSISKIGEEVKSVKDGVADIPEGLDADIAAEVKAVGTEAHDIGIKDIEAVKSSVIDTAKTNAEGINKDVQSKITDNTKARGQLEGITSKYGKDAKARAMSSLDANTKMGNDLVNALKAEIENVGTTIKNIKDNM